MTYAEFLADLFCMVDEIDMHGVLVWRSARPLETIKWHILCNDLFWRATADSVQVTPENIHILRESIDDAVAAGGADFLATELFCARIRGMRPLREAYPDEYPDMWPLLDACGPEREA